MTEFDRVARFEDFDGHRSPVLHWRPRGRVRAQAVFFAPYGDEMNQSRRMFRLTAEALAARGVAGRMFDLLGTGDSSADFREATVSAWLSDCRRMLDAAQREGGPIILIGCRLGVALAAKASEGLTHPATLLVGWAPILQGRQQLSALLRVAMVARMSRPQVPDPKTVWAAGELSWLAGYPVSSALAEQLGSLDATGVPRAARAVLLELRTAQGEAPVVASDALCRRAEGWNRCGVPTRALALPGPAFWNVADLVDVPEVLEATVECVEEALEEVTGDALSSEVKQRD